MERNDIYTTWLTKVRSLEEKWPKILQSSSGNVDAVMQTLTKYVLGIIADVGLSSKQKEGLKMMINNIKSDVVGYNRNQAGSSGAAPFDEREYGYQRANGDVFLISTASVDSSKKQKASWFSTVLANKNSKSETEIWLQKLTIFRIKINNGKISYKDALTQVHEYRSQVNSIEDKRLKKTLLLMLKIDERDINRYMRDNKEASIKMADKRKYTDTLPSIEQQLREVKKHDIIDVGHRDKEIVEISEKQLEASRVGEIEEITEGQLNDSRTEDVVEITEANLDLSNTRRPEAWAGDKIKVYEDINAYRDKLQEANDAFYKANPELKGKDGKVVAKRNGGV